MNAEPMIDTPPPFVVFGLPRSRTYWTSRFLSYAGWLVTHDELLHLRSLDDIRSWLAMTGAGTVETSAAPFWRTLRELRPDARVATIRRDPEECVESLCRVAPNCEVAATRKIIRALDHKLDTIEHRMAGVCRVTFEELATEVGCARLFQHCLPYQHDHAWWEAYAALNLQCNVPALQRYYWAHAPQLKKLTAQVKHRTIMAMRPRETVEQGIVLGVEPYSEALYREAVPLFEEHLTLMDQSPEDHDKRNLTLYANLARIGALQCVTARCNGRLFGYLVSIVAPSLDRADRTEAQHTIFFASPQFRNLGMQMQRYAIETLRERGVNDVFMRTGNRTAASPRLGTIYKRLGAHPMGEVYRLELT